MNNPETDHYPSVDTPDERDQCPYCEAREDEPHGDFCALIAAQPQRPLPELLLSVANIARTRGKDEIANALMDLMARAA
jgi:hypothetical protein